MPYAVNGIGTWYWGRRNGFVRRGVCENCGQIAELQSYHTMRFFVFLFVPIIPLGKYRVIEKCPHCSRHGFLKSAQWDRKRTEEMWNVVEAFSANRTNKTKALEAIAATAAFQDQTVFCEVARTAEQVFAADAELLDALADGHLYFGLNDEVERLLRLSLGISQSPETQERLAAHLLMHASYDEAVPILEPLLKRESEDHIPLHALAIDATLVAGRFEDTNRLIENALTLFPKLAEDPDFQRTQRDAKRGKPIKSAIIHAPPPKPMRESGLGWFIAAALPALILITALSGYLGASLYIGSSRAVHIVGALPSTYEISIGGQSLKLAPNRPATLRVSEGQIPLIVTDKSLGIPDTTITIQTPFLLRPFQNRTFIINPDQLAIIEFERATYSASGAGSSADDAHELHTNLVVHEFKDIDYEFIPFPSSLNLSNSSNSVSKTRVSVNPDIGALYAAAFLFDKAGKEATIDWIVRSMRFLTNTDDLAGVLVGMAGPAEAVTLLEPILPVRPVVLQAHRTYQTAVEFAGLVRDIEREYAALLEADPQNPRLKYLYARTLLDPDVSRAMLSEVIDSPDDQAAGYGLGALAYGYCTAGLYESAIEPIFKAGDRIGRSTGIIQIEQAVLIGAGWFEELLLSPELSVPIMDRGTLEVELAATSLVMLGRADEAVQLIDDWYQTMAGFGDGEWYEPDVAWLQATVALLQGQTQEAAQLFAQIENHPDAAFRAAILRGDLEIASAALNDPMHTPTAESALVLHLAAVQQNDSQTATQSLSAATELLSQQDREARIFADWLRGNTTPDFQLAAKLQILPDRKKLLIATLLAQHPEQFDQYRDLLNALNADPRFPHDIVQNIVESHPE